MVLTSVGEVTFSRNDLPSMPRPKRVLMTSPAYFEVAYVINPHMRGNMGSVDLRNAMAQWNALVETFKRIGLDVQLLDGIDGYPDMVFCANQTLPYVDIGTQQPGVILSKMHAHQRRGEVDYYREYFASIGYDVVALSDVVTDFEGMGDALWHPGRRLLWGGYGFRSSIAAYSEIDQVVDAPILLLQLEDPDFYHLDTCLSVLSETDALIFPGAFDSNGLALLEHFFDRLIEVPETEARGLFATNALCPDGHNVVIQAGCVESVRALKDAGYNPIEVDTSEYLKSGGSVFCMKQMYWSRHQVPVAFGNRPSLTDNTCT